VLHSTLLLPSLPHCPQVRVLTKSPKGPEVGSDDVFSYNAAFSNPLFRIKVNNIQLKETQEENAKTNEQVRPAIHALSLVALHAGLMAHIIACMDTSIRVCVTPTAIPCLSHS
jgi:hypothetical protein